jgi:hypothetical protein
LAAGVWGWVVFVRGSLRKIQAGENKKATGTCSCAAAFDSELYVKSVLGDRRTTTRNTQISGGTRTGIDKFDGVHSICHYRSFVSFKIFWRF